jgi:microcystin-dependent protein
MGALTSGQFVDSIDIDPITFDTGDVKWSARRTAASGWLKCDGAAYSRTTYATLFGVLVPTLGVVTITVASPGVFTLAAHGLVIGDRVYLTTTGALPTGLSANTIYYVVSTPTTDTFTLSATEGGSAINTSGTQSGTHSVHWCPHGLGDGSTTFNVPFAPGKTLVAAAGSSGHADVRALGQNDGTAIASSRPKHGSSTNAVTANSGIGAGGGTEGTVFSEATIGPQTNAPIDTPAYLVLNLFIKT